jgi:hypothetical protein
MKMTLSVEKKARFGHRTALLVKKKPLSRSSRRLFESEKALLPDKKALVFSKMPLPVHLEPHLANKVSLRLEKKVLLADNEDLLVDKEGRASTEEDIRGTGVRRAVPGQAGICSGQRALPRSARHHGAKLP